MANMGQNVGLSDAWAEINRLEKEIDRLREIEEAAREVLKEHDAEFGEEPWASDPDPYDQAIDRLRTALDADRGGQGGS